MKHALQKVFILSVLVIPTLFYATETNKKFLCDTIFNSAVDVAHPPLDDASFEVMPNDSTVVDGINSHVLANDAPSNDALTNNASLPILFRGDVSPANAAYTISRSGVYKLTSAKTASGVPNISITANNVTLDLGGNTLTGGTNGIEVSGNNVTVSNGTISGMTQSGVFIQGSSCHVDNCDMVLCVTGITLQSANQCVVENCRVLNMTQAGVSLVSSFTNYVHGCSVTGVYSTGDAYGFIAANGGSNVFDSCSVKNIGTTGEAIAPVYATVGLQSAIGGGIIFKGSENNSQVLNSSCLSVEQTTTCITQSFGIGLLPEVTSMQVDALLSVTHSPYAEGAVLSVAWLVSGDTKYLASGGYPVGDTGNQVKIYRFDEATSSLLSVTQSPYAEGLVASVAWLVSGDTKYLASGGSPNGDTGNQIKIYRFDEETSSLLSVTESPYAEDTVYSVAWLVSGDTKYLASGGNPSTDTGNQIKIYEFDETTSSLLPVTQSSYAEGGVESVAWLVSGDTKYLASGGYPFGNTGNQVKIYEFDETTSSLLSVTESPYAEGRVFSVAWLVSGDTKYLASGGYPSANTSNQVKIYRFDEAASSLLSVTHSPYAENEVHSVAWLISGDTKYLASGGYPNTDTGNQVKMYEFEGFTQQSPQNCLLTNNMLSSVHSFRNDLAMVGDLANGIGLSSTTTLNYVASNLCYDCDSGFAGVPIQFIDSQANARGVDNVDTNLTTLDQIEAIYNDQLSPIENQVDGLLPVSNSSVLAVNSLSGCADIPVSAPGTLSTAGTYCLADTINGTLSITGTDITLCMNEHTINGGQLIISGDRVHVAQGTVRNNAAASGVYVTGNNCFLQNIRSIVNQTGFELSGCQNNMVSNCSAISCTREGFLLNNSTRNYVADCDVQSLVGTGTVAGIKTSNGTSNTFTGCTVNGVSTTGGDAYGIWGVTEHKSIVSENTVNDVSATSGRVKGISLEQDAWLKTSLSFLWSYSVSPTRMQPRTLDWLSVSPDRAYLVVGNEFNDIPVRIFRLNGETDINLCSEYYGPAGWQAYMVKWLRYGEIFYLAVGWGNLTGVDLQIFIFDPVSETLLPLPTATYTYDNDTSDFSLCASWMVVPDGRIFLLLTGQGSPNAQILSFDGSYLTLLNSMNSTINSFGGDWISISTTKILIALSSFVSTGPDLVVYEYDIQANTLTLKDSKTVPSTGQGQSVSWLLYDGHYYLAFSVWSPNSNPGLYVYPYSLDTGTLGSSTTGISGTNSVYTSDWLVSGTSLYIACGTNNGVKPIIIEQFDPNVPSLTEVFSQAFSGVTHGLSAAWFQGLQGRALLAVGYLAESNPSWRALSILGFDIVDSTTSLLQNNTVSNVFGTGIKANPLADNVFSNKVYNAATPYEPWKPFQFDPSNNNGIAYS